MKIRLKSLTQKDKVVELDVVPNLINVNNIYCYEGRNYRFIGYIYDLDLMEFDEVQMYELA